MLDNYLQNEKVNKAMSSLQFVIFNLTDVFMTCKGIGSCVEHRANDKAKQLRFLLKSAQRPSLSEAAFVASAAA